MILDNNLIYSESQAETTIAGHNSNVLDHGRVNADIGKGTSIFLDIRVVDACTSGGSATVTFSFQTSEDATNWTMIFQTKPWPISALTAGKQVLRTPLPDGLLRYTKVVYTIGTAALTGGSFDADLHLGA